MVGQFLPLLCHDDYFITTSLLGFYTSLSYEMAAAVAADLQQTPFTFHSRCAPSSRSQSVLTINLSLIGIKLHKLTVKPRQRSSQRGGGSLGSRMADSVTGSYANALADVAKCNNTLEKTCTDLEAIDKIFSDDKVVTFFTSPVLKDEEKIKVINEVAKQASLQPHVVNFLNILVDMKRIGLIKEIIRDFEVVYNKLTDTELAIVTSVVQLDSQHLAQVAKTVQKLTGGKNVRIKTLIDPSLVAGFTVRYGKSGSKLIDMSVRKQLEEIAFQLDLGDIQLAA